MSTADISRKFVSRQHCYEDPATVLGHTPDGWMVCSVCGRRFRIDGPEVVERIPVGEFAGTHSTIATGTVIVMEKGESRVVGDESTTYVPMHAAFFEFRW